MGYRVTEGAGERVRRPPPLLSDEVGTLLTPREVAALFRVHVRTVGRWAGHGRLSVYLTPGGARRYRADQVRALPSERMTTPDTP